MIEAIQARIADLPQQRRQLFAQLFDVDVTTGHALPPPEMERWVIQQFGALEPVREQTIVKIVNRLTLESALFNPLRARRPTKPGGGDPALEEWIAREQAEHDIFRDPERDTTADVFGRIRGQHCVTASNVAKYAGWHGLVIFDEPHPLRFGTPQLRDYLDVALRWLAAAHARDAQAIYPIITWNCLPKSGATIMHGHMQIALTRGMHYTHVERWRRAAVSYRARAGARYFDDLFALHAKLELAIPFGAETRVFAHLTPARNREIVLLAQALTPVAAATLASQWERGSGGEGLPTVLATILRRLIDEQGMRAFNVAIALPPLGPAREDWRAMPIIARIADRGDPLTTRGDMGAMELFAANVITADPFEVAAQLRQDDKMTR
jgi:galactose-1-phosphate uridylyltransferase